MKISLNCCLLAKYLLLLIFYGVQISLFSQESSTSVENDSASATSPAYMPVDYAFLDPLFIHSLKYIPVDTSIVYAHYSDPLFYTNNLYQTLGIGGQAHQKIDFDFEREVGFSYIHFPYPLYFKQQKDIALYRLKTSFTKIHYTLGIPDENRFTATHAQKFKELTVVFNLAGYLNQGYYAHQKMGDMSGDILLHYELPSQLWGIRASYIYNRIRNEENGGLFDMNNFKEQMTSNLQGYNMKLYYANTQIQSHDFLIHNYINIQPKSKTSGKSYYLGTLSHTFQYKQIKSYYTDTQLDSAYYCYQFYSSSDSTKDSIRYENIINTIQWSSYKPYQNLSSKNYFVHFSGGLRYEYTETTPAHYFGNSFSLFAQTSVRLFAALDLNAKLSYSFLDYNHNDAFAEIKGELFFNRQLSHLIGVNTNFYRLSPDYIFSYYKGNHTLWDTTWSKRNVLKFSAYWKLKNYEVSFNYFVLKDWLLLDNSYTPFTIDDFINIFQLKVFAPIRIKNFGIDIFAVLQHSDNKFVPVPIFAGKSTIFYIFNLFQNKMQLQIGNDMMYNTSYLANGYYPLLHQFYYQTKNIIGNYFYVGPYINFKVQRIQFYFRLSHALSGLLGYNYFTTPDYPMQGRNYAIGLSWRFYD